MFDGCRDLSEIILPDGWETNSPDAIVDLGVCIVNRKDVGFDHAEAVKWIRKIAEQGHAEAQYSLGDCCYFGHGVDHDYAEAVKWYRKAAEQGFAEAQYRLGDCYYWGNGVDEDDVEAVKWYRGAKKNVAADGRRTGPCPGAVQARYLL